MQKLFLTFFYSGLAPKAPGTFGTLAGQLVGIGLLFLIHMNTFALLMVVISVVGILEINKYEKISGEHDNSWIVIDEVAGIWLAMTLVPFDPLSMVLVFAFFRLYDIWKPSLIGRIDRDVKGGLGVMGDDLLAGVLAGLSTLLVMEGVQTFI
jgi:phosphatidylglycerophosphatase A